MMTHVNTYRKQVNKRNAILCENIISENVTIPQYFKRYINGEVDLDEMSNPVVCCPLHDEDTPSWRYSPKMNIWRCFGQCDTSGGVIKLHQLYTQKMTGKRITYYQALDSFRNLFPQLQNMPPIFENNDLVEEDWRSEITEFKLKPEESVRYYINEILLKLNRIQGSAFEEYIHHMIDLNNYLSMDTTDKHKLPYLKTLLKQIQS